MVNPGAGTVLVVDDEPHLRASLRELLEEAGYAVLEAGDGEEALAALARGPMAPDALFLDLKMPHRDGLATLGALREHPGWRRVPVVILTAFGTSGATIEAMKGGAYDYLTKPFDGEEILRTARRAVEVARLTAEVETLRGEVGERRLEAEGELIGQSPAMREVFKRIGRAAPSDATVLITGESGTGKELVARAIHRHSPRAGRPFVVLNCPAIPEPLLESELFGHARGAFTGAVQEQAGRFEQAASGTVFLDEVADLPLGTQAKLPRVLQERTVERLGARAPVRVDFRLIAATNQDLRSLVATTRFREDLFYRVDVLRIPLPPLRERRADIAPLAEHFLRRYGAEAPVPPRGFTAEAMQALLADAYPGNVRELENVVRRAVVLARGPLISAADLRGSLAPAAPGVDALPGLAELLVLPYAEALHWLERELIRRALDRAKGNKA